LSLPSFSAILIFTSKDTDCLNKLGGPFLCQDIKKELLETNTLAFFFQYQEKFDRVIPVACLYYKPMTIIKDYSRFISKLEI
jgi:hypothetical protein